MTATIHTTQVDLDGLLEVLGRSLYSTPSVALRELIQNAHDACERYRIETAKKKDFCIQLITNNEEKSLVIQDNGSGLTRQEILDFLATIGSGYTRLLRQSKDSESMIGYFGLGFLSAYVVTNLVEVTTCSYQTPDDTWTFSSAGGKKFTIKPANKTNGLSSTDKNQSSGTQVKLYLSDEFESLANPDVLLSLVRKYCCLLPIAIVIDHQPEPANNLIAPWVLEESVSPLQLRKKQIEFAQIFEGDFDPIVCIPIPKENIFQLSGLIWIQDGSSYSTSDNRNVSVFTRNMYITNEIHEFLPRWAGFVGGVFESSKFIPTASREGLQKNDYYYDVIEYINEILVTGLRDIVLREPESWRRILTRHNQSLLGAALTDERLFEVTHKSLKVPTTEGEMTVPQLLKNSNGNIHIKNDLPGGYEETLFRAQLTPVVLGYLFAATAFCREYGRTQNISVRILGEESSETKIFKSEIPDPALQKCFESLFQHLDEEILYTRFQPEYIPLVVIEDDDVKLKKKIEDDEADRRIASAALSLARLHTKSITKTKERRVYLNLDNTVISNLINISEDKRGHVAVLIRSYMDGLHQHVNTGDAGLGVQMKRFNQSLLNLMELV
jgi:molecular chaperone HtpG